MSKCGVVSRASRSRMMGEGGGRQGALENRGEAGKHRKVCVSMCVVVRVGYFGGWCRDRGVGVRIVVASVVARVGVVVEVR